MKKVIFFLLIAAIFSACKDDELKLFKLNPTAKVYFKPNGSAQKAYFAAKSSETHLSPLEVVKQAQFLVGFNRSIGESFITWTWVGKDTTSATPALLRWGTDIIYDTDGFGHYGLQTDFINSYDLVICAGDFLKFDTIAYIPNANMTSAKSQILKALSESDTLAVYGIFRDAFKFTPITGPEYLELKRQNLQ